MNRILCIVPLFLLASVAAFAAERSVSLSALLAPVDFTREYVERKAEASIVEPVVKERVSYTSIRLSDLLLRLEEYLSPEVGEGERLTLSSNMRYSGRRVRSDAWWDIDVKTPFAPDGNGRWYPLVELIVDGESVSTIRIPIHVSHFKEVWILNQNVTRGALLPKQAISPVVRDVYDMRTLPIATHEILDDYELERSLSKGRILTWDDLKPQPQVRRNSIVDVFVQQGALQVRMRARAMEDGLLGDIVTLRNLDTSREFFASVSGKNTVEFEL